MANLPAVNNTKIMDLKAILERSARSIKDVAASNITPERIVKMALVAASRNPDLLLCDPQSILRCLMDASQLGLEPFTGIDRSYIIPRNNKVTGKKEATFMPSYRGLVDLARRSGQLKSISADIIHENDKFEIEKGLNPKLVHVPNYSKDRGKPILVYAVAILKDGAAQFEVMTTEEVESIRSKSPSGRSGPWANNWGEMAKKTAIRRIAKLLPMSIELEKAITIDNAAESGETYYDVDSFEVNETPAEEPVTKADSLVEKLSGVTPQ
jgi:recombination protein RecT